MSKVQGNGTIVQLEKDKPRGKCRKWKLVVPIGRDLATGKYRQKNRNVQGTYTDAQKALRAFIKEIEDDKVALKRTKYTLVEYTKRYADERLANGTYTPNSAYTLKRVVGSVSHLIGYAHLSEITPDMLSKVYIKLRQGESLSGKPLSGTSVNNIHRALNSVFRHAVKQGLMAKNPCDDVTPPMLDTQEKLTLTEEQAHHVVGALSGKSPYECVVLLCLTLGLRRGEACGLQWGDVDFERNTISIKRSQDSFGNIKRPKTLSGIRELPMPKQTAEALLTRRRAAVAYLSPAQLDYHEANDGSVEMAPKSDVYIYAKADGTLIMPERVNGWWHRHRDELGAPNITLHELRHTFITLAAQQGIHPSVTQKLAGHKNPNVTMAVYTHVQMKQKEQAMQTLEQLF